MVSVARAGGRAGGASTGVGGAGAGTVMGRTAWGRVAGPVTGMTAVASRPIGGGRAALGHGPASMGRPSGQGQASDGEDRVGPGGAARGQTQVEAAAV
jgi:hypothetical protein